MLKRDKKNVLAILKRAEQEARRKLASLKGEMCLETSPDQLDQVVSATNCARAAKEIDALDRRMRLIEHAISKVDDSSYGTCESCEQEISPKRLKAIPWAALCTPCQEAQDRELDLLSRAPTNLHSQYA